MAKVVGDIAVQVGADVSNLQSGMRSAGRSVQGFDKRAAKMGKNVAAVGVAVAAALAGLAIGAAKLASTAAATAKEIQTLSNVAGVGVERFQRYTQAARSVGIEQDKLADIFKDVNDKFGDFLETGAGPLADFFEQIAPAIGVTAEQFARLSGPEALQLYVSSLEKAGIPHERMTFYMEALASDATALIPLLRDGGSEMQRLGDQAERSGRIMSQSAVAGGAALDDKLRELSDTIRINLSEAVLENADDIVALAEAFTETLLPALLAVAGFVADVSAAIAEMVGEIGSAIGAVVDFGATVADMIGVNGPQGGSGGRRTTGNRTTNQDQLAPQDPDAFDPRNGVYGDFSSDYDANVEAEEAAREESLARLQAFRERQEEIEKTADESRLSGRADTAERLAALEERAQQQRFKDISGAFGNLSVLMVTENKKLFKIGQAAAVAQAIVDGYAAATSAWKHGMAIGGPPVATAFTAASLARTGALVASIASASANGSGGGAAASGGGAGSTGGTESPGTYYTVNLQGEGSIGRGDVRDLLEALGEEINNGGRIAGLTVS
ncbi:hypothetical protein [Roseobacter litoralis]|uniref:hypothetical protein n=1 Tax=Roseobacter litoralis TaxID=42443 RepID=UPI002495657F|nr:hypothetical protein [Roseobacter litoralis]